MYWLNWAAGDILAELGIVYPVVGAAAPNVQGPVIAALVWTQYAFAFDDGIGRELGGLRERVLQLGCWLNQMRSGQLLTLFESDILFQ